MDREEILTGALGEGTAVAAEVRLPGGASRETWALDAVDPGGGVHELILRLDSPGSAPGAGIGLAGEAALMRAAAAEGVPVPRILSAGEAHILMTRVAGETIPRRILRDEAFAAVRPRLAARCGEILAAVHRMPLSCLPGTPAPPEASPDPRSPRTGSGPRAVPAPQSAPDDPLAAWRDLLDLTGQPHPVFELALRRLAASRPPGDRTTVVHGDFRNGNLIIAPDGVRAVLDWELAHAGDPLEDLGWLCVKSWRFGSPLPVGGFGEYDELVEAYEKASGYRVDRDALRWWEIFGVLKWGIICVMQAMRHLGGGARSVELAAIGRRVCETEWDLLRVL
ncbi:phosphotransferase family protein [Planomonospora venezuelensis]|uniref:Aminoglycoside phosphotransferase (APT) family kinase protein n=1 Tax=Planomonospora venezuelensis TaxID=1999 RepID=A0A841DIR8_PLAVE|nr:phosphotransferase family protein [Planomonospora venezuelensis]MBB5967046.1 aminoglycoside phosphotransferase (APT) family kinase protein [Planomonospora venezuelensis]GIN01484.1 tyrosine protein kinase:aminoglycoside phosphotransferase [Planomonospora venezuelensis]